ncbi:sulfotransferase [Anaerolineales bacterium HSG24]|nr:sulfotransferase [Anaerolineales bacterium HSG24]
MFVLSTGRVGSETLATLYKLANNVLSYHEPVPKLYALSKLSYRYHSDSLGQTILQEALSTTRKELFNYSLSCRKGYIETSPQATFLAPIILQVVPNVRFIHLVRDPHDVVRSGMRRGWYNGNNMADKTRITPNSESEHYESWDNYTMFQKNVWLWSETNNWIINFLSTIPAEQRLTITSENMFNAHQKTLENLFSFINSSLPSKKKIETILRKRLNAQRVGNFPEFSDWTGEMNEQLHGIASKTIKILDYNI